MKKSTKRLFTKNYQIEDPNILNDLSFYDYLERLESLALARFVWELKPGMNQDFLEKTLYFDGESTLLKTEDYGFLNTKCSHRGGLNHYDQPTGLHCYGAGGKISFERDLYISKDENSTNEFDEAILVKNKINAMPTNDAMFLFAVRLANCDRISDVNLDSQRTPWIVLIDEKQRLTFENILNQRNSNKNVIVGNKNNLNPDNFKSIDISSPFVIDKIQDYKTKIWNEVLTYLGINNLQDEKKERLIQEEINSNNEVINLNLQNFFAPRQEACKQFNEKFNLTGKDAISVKLRSDLHNVIKNTESVILGKQPEINKVKEGEENV